MRRMVVIVFDIVHDNEVVVHRCEESKQQDTKAEDVSERAFRGEAGRSRDAVDTADARKPESIFGKSAG